MQPDGSCKKVRNRASCTPTKVGEHTVTATLPPGALPIVNYQLQATDTLRVIDPVVSLALKPAEATILVGTDQDYIAEGTTAAGRTVNVTDQTGFTITKPGKCSQAPGTVSCTASEIGDYTVTGTLTQKGRDDLTAKATLRVIDPVVSLALKPAEATILVGTDQDYIAEGTTAAGRTVNVTDQTGFTITKPGKCSQAPGTVSCTASEIGDYTVTGTLTQKGRDDLTAKATLRVIDPVVSLALKPAEATILVGTDQDYIAEGTTAAGRTVNVTDQTGFTITKPGKCSQAPGTVSCTASEIGDYTVTGTLTQKGRDDLTAKATLRVIDPVVSLALKPAEATILVGTDQDYIAEGTTAAGRTVNVTDQTGFTITKPGKCSQAPGTVSCTASEIGDYTVTGTLTQKGRDDLTAKATLRVIDPVVSLALKPAEATILVGTDQDYIAEGTTAAGRTVNVTDQTGFTITKPGKCSQAPGTVSCTASEIGDYTVTGTLTQKGRDDLTAKATLTVVPRPTTSTTTTTSGTTTTTPASQPVISSVQPGFTFAGMSVDVGGNTGSCSRAGTLTFHGNTGDVSVKVTADRQGNFVARVTIPKGTFPWAYQLELTVDCNGQLQRAQADLNVVNIAPTAAEDSARTIQDTPVSIRVTDNDRNPDPDTGYPTLVLVSGAPSHGTAETQTDQSIIYTPEQGFVGQDQFRYSLCDDVLNAAGTADCSAATVTVTVIDAQACLPSPGSISSIKVNPSKGPGGKTLGITATVDRKIAACPFRLLLGGTPLGPDVQAGPDGSIATERGVPKDAEPGPASSGWPRCAPRRWPRRRSRSFHRG